MDERNDNEREPSGNVLDMTNYGACRYCGQIVNIQGKGATDIESAAEYATRGCSCNEAKRYAEAVRVREEAARMREYVLRRAKDQIALLFGNAVLEYGTAAGEGMKEDLLEILYQFSVMVYDEVILKIAVNLTGEIKATISKNSKGRLQIQRTSALTVKREV